MENLSRIAQGIFLGNGEVWNFLDDAVNRNCGGLLTYTRAEYEPKGKKNYLISNILQNFNSGRDPRYKYNDIPWTGGYKYDGMLGGHTSADVGKGGNIGDIYSVPTTSNSDLKFLTTEEYKDFQRGIRDYQTLFNGLTYYENNDGEYKPYENFPLESYAGEVSDEYKATNLSPKSLGDDVDIQYAENRNSLKQYTLLDFGKKAKDASDRYRKMVKDKIRDKNLFPGIYRDYSAYTVESYNGTDPISLSEDRYKVRKINEEGRIYKVLKTLTSVASEKRAQNSPEERKLLTKYFEGSLNPDGYKVTVNTEGYGEVLIDTKKHKISEYINKNNGLYDYYDDERRKYKSPLEGIRNPWGNKSLWNNNNSYGVETNNRGEERYSINEEHIFNGEVPISSKFNSGEQTTLNRDNGVRTYSYFQESENGSAPTSVNHMGEISDGSSVILSDYDGTSRLLKKTNELFKSAKINSLINRFHTDAKDIDSELITAADSNFGLSRGRNLLKKEYEGKQVGDTSTGYDNPYCRVWTAHHQYSKLKHRIRPFVGDDGKSLSLSETQSNYGLMRPEGGLTRLNDYSVLGADGFVKITPTHDNGKLVQEADKLKNYMFSIENLAWRDVTKNETSKALSKEQRGPNGGRIMWFPPYNLKFSENVNVNWNANSFIGRGEEIYTYTNTVRSGTLDFTLLIDHPSILNKWRGTSEDVEEKEKRERDLLRFFAGCGNLNDEVEAQKPIKETETPPVEEIPLTTPEPTFYSKDIAYVIFFPNDFSAKDYVNKGNLDDAITILKSYNGGGSYDGRDESYKHEILQSHNLTSNGFTPSSYEENIKKQLLGEYGDDIEVKFFNDLEAISSNFQGNTIFGHPSVNCEIKNVTVKGFASSHGYESNNRDLCNRRRTFIQKLIEYKCQELSEANVEYAKLEGSTISVPDIDGREDVNSLNAKIARAAYAVVSISWKEENIAYNAPLEGTSFSVNGQNLSSKYKLEKTVADILATASSVTYTEDDYTYDNEYLYFANVRGDEMVYKNILDKVRYFDPAYHSITPEGFNARLTFLHQCTRQGPTNAVTSGRVKGKEIDESGNTLTNGSPDYLKFAGNLSFGRAPYCILRIGDFFNTKICIDSMSINYDNNGGVQWDLNPEGVGVQPMYANISISFKFLGGQDITRPIERLQNAVTANYYANASVYNRHADNNKFYFDALEDHANLKD